MQNSNVPTLRRSSRVPIAVPILVTSLDPRANFSEVCETLEVSAHGCMMTASMKLKPEFRYTSTARRVARLRRKLSTVSRSNLTG